MIVVEKRVQGKNKNQIYNFLFLSKPSVVLYFSLVIKCLK